MIRFPGFMRSHRKGDNIKEQRRHMAQRGWGRGDMTKPLDNYQFHMPMGKGRHFALDGMRGRGMKIFKS